MEKLLIFTAPLILTILGVILRTGKGGFLISGYNTCSKDEKDNFDEVALGKFISNLLFFVAVVFTIIGIATILNYTHLMFIIIFASVSTFFTAIAAVIYMNTGNRFQK
ncbi:MAG: hypothetical protein ACI8WT_004818 [Clostridium sp.]|jgi:hypothetical protein